MHLLGLHCLSQIGTVRLKTLVNYYGDYEAAWQNFDEWPAVLGKGIDYRELREEWRQTDLPNLYESFLLSDSRIVTLDDAKYPRVLTEIEEPPYMLFYRGELPKPQDLTVAIIGSRRATAYGKEAAAYFADGLTRAGVWIVGGMARGIDSAAHRAALNAGGKTIGVLGCGIDIVYPRENHELFAAAAQNGCIISEYPLGMQPLSRNFPMRNRVVSGLSRGVLVVEAGLKSGTQITVDYAGAQGRNIYAVPGSIFSPSSAGTHRLIKEGIAKPAVSAEDILEDFAVGNFAQTAIEQQLPFYNSGAAEQKNSVAPPKGGPLPADMQERKLVEFLTEQRHFNDIVRELGWNSADLAGTLTLLELGGFIKRLDGQYYIRRQT